MNIIYEFLNTHKYILPTLCFLIIVLLLAITVCLSLIIRMQKKKLNEAETDFHSCQKRSVREHDSLSTEIAVLQKKLNRKEQECTELLRKIKDYDFIKSKYYELVTSVEEEKQQRQRNRQDYLEKEKQEKEQHDFYKELANQKLQFTPEQLIRLRNKTVMNADESRKFYHICEEFKEPIYTQKYGTDHIYVFAQVALHSVFERTKTGVELDDAIEDTYVRRFFLSKSIDFLVCAAYFDKDEYYYNYKPILGIEIDGKYHENPDIQERDEIKQQLFNAVGIPFLRFPLEENKGDKTAIRGKIKELLLK